MLDSLQTDSGCTRASSALHFSETRIFFIAAINEERKGELKGKCTSSHYPDYSVVKWLGVRSGSAADQQKGMQN